MCKLTLMHNSTMFCDKHPGTGILYVQSISGNLKNYYIHRHVKLCLGFLPCLCGTLPLASPDFNIKNVMAIMKNVMSTPSATSFINGNEVENI